ncbi:MAG: hypothetical protein E6H99_02520 [Chloroflexi bacterium]|nr:MAG: hypothetical protein E6I13_03800 [Chloroflexota bacterium]TMG22562.1 MAG: hypothetical protein E6H99_02520 [Chloroflexota bacterium]TMG68118.1 MAG: hypothetical protein E6H82_02485 [Chloroflexota bacterium]
MAKTRNAVLIPLWVAVVAAGVLLALMLRAEAVLGPTKVSKPTFIAAPSPSTAPSTNPSSSDAVQRSIGKSQTTTPRFAPVAPQSASETAPAPGPAQCPPHAGSGLPCVGP